MATAVRRSGVGFLAKSFTAEELAYCLGDPQRLAGRWAAKEAVIKCFDRTPICFRRGQIEVLSSDGGAPRVRLLDGDPAGARVEVSITHHSGMAVAAAILEMGEPEESLLPPPPDVHVPERPLEGHKGTFGSVVAIAGSLGLTGAAYLCATGAARAGAGTVRLLVAATIYPILATKCTEVMATPVSEVSPGALGPAAYEAAIEGHLKSAACGLLGPGLGQAGETRQLIRRTLTSAGCPLVVDADALNAIAAERDLLGQLRGDRILTPHPGEMARLTGLPTTEVQRDRRGIALKAASEWGAVVVLKGAHTIVAGPDGQVAEDPHEVPALGTGGTGDVLSGVIAGLVAQHLDPFQAAVTGVYVHAEAGRRISGRLGASGLLASDLFDEIPLVMRALRLAGR
ncbi:MAG: NAD(P)H-hydrate dehydratase [Candidatus Dormibacteraeota bacterium]|nr:NAD(P)H-hydrate dehydratase [Candidatus Dormibacteraeota bacterium]